MSSRVGMRKWSLKLEGVVASSSAADFSCAICGSPSGVVVVVVIL